MKNLRQTILRLIKQPVFWFLAFVVIAWALTVIAALVWGSSGGGTFGDTFGAVNALFSGLAFVGLIYAILLQRQELELQRKELEETREELKGSRLAQEAQNAFISRQVFEATFFQLLRNFNDLIDGIDLVENARVTKGRDALRVFHNRATKELGRQLSARGDRNDHQIVHDSFAKFYESWGHEVGHYFRALYNILKFVDRSEVADKHFYAHLVRAQMSDAETALLSYDGLSSHGAKIKAYLERYNMLKHIRANWTPGISVTNLYVASAFNDEEQVVPESIAPGS